MSKESKPSPPKEPPKAPIERPEAPPTDYIKEETVKLPKN